MPLKSPNVRGSGCRSPGDRLLLETCCLVPHRDAQMRLTGLPCYMCKCRNGARHGVRGEQRHLLESEWPASRSSSSNGARGRREQGQGSRNSPTTRVPPQCHATHTHVCMPWMTPAPLCNQYHVVWYPLVEQCPRAESRGPKHPSRGRSTRILFTFSQGSFDFTIP
jgi:hypothetical protein